MIMNEIELKMKNKKTEHNILSHGTAYNVVAV